MDSGAIADAFLAVRDRQVNSIVVVRGGCLVAEAYSDRTGPEDPQDMRSVAKSLTSALVGIALKEGKLHSVDQRLAEFFPELAHDPLRSEITIQHLLYMASGLEWNNVNEQASVEMMHSDHWVRTILQHPGLYKPGTKFNYSNGDAHLVSAVLQRATGEAMLDYASARLFRPLGIRTPSWNHDPQGITIGAWALALTARDMAKLGLLYMMEGQWDGTTVLPEAWIRESLTKRIVLSISKQAYGYYWWTKPLSPEFEHLGAGKLETFYAAGSGGNRIFVVPELQLIVAMTAHTPVMELPEQVLNGIVRAIRSDQPIPESLNAGAKLAEAIEWFRAGSS